MSNELVAIENINAVAVFGGDGLDDLLEKITTEAKSLVPDTSTNKGRKEIASMAAKVAKSKTRLDGMGKDLVSDWKAKSKAVDAERKIMRDRLDSLKAEVRLPLTEYEEAEKEREKLLNNRVEDITNRGISAETNWMTLTADNMARILEETQSENIDTFAEFAPYAAKEKDKAVAKIQEAIEKRQKYDNEQTELEKLRADAAKREEEERKEKLRKEGEERALKEAKAVAEAKELQAKKDADVEKERLRIESERVEREKQAAIDARKAAEQRAIEAEESAKRKAEEAAQAERDRIDSERVAEELAAKKREEDTKHRAKINNAAANALDGITKAQAKAVITAIAKGQIPHVTIAY